MTEIIIENTTINEIYKGIKLAYPTLSQKLIKRYTITAILMIYKNKQTMSIHAPKKTLKKDKKLSDKVYTISIKENGSIKPKWMLTN